ncbi:LysE family translocator [Aliagarivorans marinus]|uniref:LysE family translocator n=1 Tax=Aliagarivorans marinus TaxID=561965 RepID=UPI0004289F12|nr:LysE family translocator [Aliagarivorans marinus]
MDALLALLTINLLGMLTPGPDMLLVLRYSAQSKQLARRCVAGILLGFTSHILLALAGISLLVTQVPWLFQVVRFGGAGYLCFIGLKILQHRKLTPAQQEGVQHSQQALRSGLSCNLLNPKVLVFAVSIFSQFITADTSAASKLLMSSALLVQCALVWLLLIEILGAQRIQSRLFNNMPKVNTLSGSMLLGMGTLLGLHS